MIRETTALQRPILHQTAGTKQLVSFFDESIAKQTGPWRDRVARDASCLRRARRVFVDCLLPLEGAVDIPTTQ